MSSKITASALTEALFKLLQLNLLVVLIEEDETVGLGQCFGGEAGPV